MSTAAAMKIPQALSGPEIKDGIAADIRAAGLPENVVASVRIGLDRTCLLNRQSYTKFAANWKVWKGNWKVDFELDDYGRVTSSSIGGILPADADVEKEGHIEPMPPDTFRRKTEQPIPQPTTVKGKSEDAASMTKAASGRGSRKMQ